VEKFISGAGQQVEEPAAPRQKKLPTMIRIDAGIARRIDQAARRLGISRSAFLVQSAVRELERMEI
jgi:uncharacterized protein (DUF1778 family)